MIKIKLTMYIEPWSPDSEQGGGKNNRFVDAIQDLIPVFTDLLKAQRNTEPNDGPEPDLQASSPIFRPYPIEPASHPPACRAVHAIEGVTVASWPANSGLSLERAILTYAIGAPPAPGTPLTVFLPNAAPIPYTMPTPLEPQHPFQPDVNVAGPGPAPATPATNVQAAEEARRQAKGVLGYQTFADLMYVWVQGFGEPVAQPDRTGALQAIINDPAKAGAMITWVRSTGGLRKACAAVTNEASYPPGHVDRVAETMAQVSSAMAFADLSDLLEPVPRLPSINPN